MLHLLSHLSSGLHIEHRGLQVQVMLPYLKVVYNPAFNAKAKEPSPFILVAAPVSML
jgi:hypothetical protein